MLSDGAAASPLTVDGLRLILDTLVPSARHSGVYPNDADGVALTAGGPSDEVRVTILEAASAVGGGLRAEALVSVLQNGLLPMTDASLLAQRPGMSSYFTQRPGIVYVTVAAPPPPRMPPLPPRPPEGPAVSMALTSSEGGAATGIVIVGVVVFLVALAVVTLLYLRRRHRNDVIAGRVTVRQQKPAAGDTAYVARHEEAAGAENAARVSIPAPIEAEDEPFGRSPGPVLPTERESAKLMLAMGALKTLMLARTPEELQQAILHAQMISGLPPEALAVAREQLALMQSGGTTKADSALEERMRAMVLDMQSKMDMVKSLQAKLQAMHLTQVQLEQENQLLRASTRRASASSSEDEDEQAMEDRLAREAYASAKRAMMDVLANGETPTPALYLERDVHLYRLSEADIKAEYVFYTRQYLGDDTKPTVRGMAEMTLMKLGEIVEQPQVKRSKLIERQLEDARKAREAREREESRSVGQRAERQRQAEMNKQAYIECRGRWEQLREAMMASTPGLTDTARTLGKRVANRSELRLVLMPPDDVRRMAPGSFVAMGTNGLEPTELRAVAHALSEAAPTGAGAQRFMAMLHEKVAKLDDFVPSAWDMFDGATSDAPLGLASGRGTTSQRTLSATTTAQPSAAQAGPSLAPAPAPPPLPPPAPLPPPTPPRRRGSSSTEADPRAAMMDELVRRASSRKNSVAAGEASLIHLGDI